ncbi:MAG: 4-hydroxy-tetrahydrodipicolinate synthase [Bacteroidota bacterium]
MNQLKFRGTGVALITPFKGDEVDYNALGNLIEYVIAGGVDFLVSLGTTGEAVALTTDECRAVFDFTIEKVAKRKPLVAGLFGGNFTRKLVRAIRSYEMEGFDAIMSSNPAYLKPPQEGIYKHYMQVAEASSLPIIIYNVPSRTGSNVLPETILKLAHADEKFIAVKEASGNLGQAMQIIKNRPDDFLVLSGEDPLTLPMLSCGADGVISVIANTHPKHFSEMVRTALNNDYTRAAALNLELLDIHPLLYVEGNPVGIKGAANLMGLCSKEVRVPLVPLSEEATAKLKRELDKVKSI